MQKIFFILLNLIYFNTRAQYRNYKQLDVESKAYSISNKQAYDTTQSFYKLAINSIDSMLNLYITHTKIPFTKAQPECNLGNWLADACLQYTLKIKNVQACVLAYDVLKKDFIPAGDIYLKDLLAIVPKEITLKHIELDGQDIQHLCDTIASIGGTPIAGLTFKIINNAATDITINNQNLNPHLLYKIIIDDVLLHHKKFKRIFYNKIANNLPIGLRSIVIQNSLNKLAFEKLFISTLQNRIVYEE